MSRRLTDLRVMLSYARADAGAFSRELADALEAANFDVLLDIDDIEAATDWQERLSDMIRAVDTLVIVVTPGWIASEMCQWELEEALRQNKRIIPLVLIEPTDTPAPEEVRRLNYIYFDGRQTFGAALKELAPALRVNLAWIRNHTHYSESARLWAERNRDPAMFLRGAELKRAQAWRDEREPEFPEISVSLNEFINLSVAHETQQAAERKRSTSWIVAVFLIVPGTLAITSGYTLGLNFARLQGMPASDMREFLELLIWQIFIDNLALSLIVCGVLFSIGGLWLQKNLSTRLLAGIAGLIAATGLFGFVVLDQIAPDIVRRANAIDAAAAQDEFELNPCATTVRQAFDRYRDPKSGLNTKSAELDCDARERGAPIINSWRQRVAPGQYAPVFAILVLPLLAIIFWRLLGGRRRSS